MSILKKLLRLLSQRRNQESATEEEWLNNQIYEKAKNPYNWLEQAEYLHAAGNAVEAKTKASFEEARNEPDFFNKGRHIVATPEYWMTFSGVMLWGFALENLAKGLIVAKKSGSISRAKDGELKTRWIQSHELKKLMKRAGVALSNEEKDLLSLLSQVTIWGGRYPAPFGQSYKRLDMEWNDQRKKCFDGIYDKLHKALTIEVTEYNEDNAQKRKALESAEYRRLREELDSNSRMTRLDNGVVNYQARRKPPTQDIASISCAKCHTQFEVGKKIEAALCLCETLYYAKYQYDGDRGRLALNVPSLKKSE